MKLRHLTSSSTGRPLKDQVLEGRQFSARALTAFLIILAAIFLLSLRYIYLQVINYEEFTARSITNQVRIVPVAPNRGLIYDRRGRPIAENRPAYRLELVPEKVVSVEQAIDRLGLIVDLPDDALEKFQYHPCEKVYMVSQQERKGKRGSMNSSVSSMLKPAPKFASIQTDSLGEKDLMNVMSSSQLRQK